MPRGGLRRDSRGTTNHLFRNKWRLGKTTAIRIPEVLKDFFLSIAKQLDESKIEFSNASEVIDKFSSYKTLKSNLEFYRNEVLNLREERQKLSLLIQNQSKQKNQKNKYQIAVECFEEFVENQELDFEDLSKARRGTKKHQLWQIKNWFESKQKS